MQSSPIIVCFPFIGDLIGGNHISALGLIERLDRSRFTPLVVLRRTDGPVARLFDEAGIPFASDPGRSQLVHGRPVSAGALLGLLPDLAPRALFLRRRGVRIVHSNDGRCHAAWGLAARLAGAKLLWHHRGDPTASGLRHAPWLAHRIVAVSRFAAGRDRRQRERAEVIFSPFDTGVTEDRAERRRALIGELGVAADTRLIGYFGVPIERKRPLMFVDTLAAMHRQRPDIPLTGLFFGEDTDGAHARIAERASMLGMDGMIRFMGFRSPGARWIAACDLLMVTAVDEPLGRTLVEAMLVGTPVAATASGGNAEAIEHMRTGLLAPPDDPPALAQAAIRLLTDAPLRTGLCTAASARARDHFDAGRHADRIMRIYDEMLGRRAAGLRPIRLHELPGLGGNGQ